MQNERRRLLHSRIRTAAEVIQLLLAVGVGIAVILALVSDPLGSAPWAVVYLTWCAKLLQKVSDRYSSMASKAGQHIR
jgi:hypothetical protein